MIKFNKAKLLAILLALISTLPISTRISIAQESAPPAKAQESTSIPKNKPACKGDASRPTPPVPNYPFHVRNVVWKNMRMMCSQEIGFQPNTDTTSNR